MKKIRIITASAGTGKTEQVANTILESLLSSKRGPSGVIATTFTRKAAAELTERLRTRLHQAGRHDEAHLLDLGLIGTVHSIAGRLIQRFAFQAGLSPELEIIEPNRSEIIFAQALAQVIERHDTGELFAIFARFGLNYYNREEGVPDWPDFVRQVVDAARTNRIEPESLGEHAQYSLDLLKEVLPVAGDAKEIEGAVLAAIAAVRENYAPRIAAKEYGFGGAVKYLHPLEDFERKAGRGHLSNWSVWVKLAKAEPTKAFAGPDVAVREAALRYVEHPAFHADIIAAIRSVFAIAADALIAYGKIKRAYGVLDYTDLEYHALDLLRMQEVRQELADEIEIFLVDEFQDTNPIQLAIFLELADIAQQTVWVGDPKQSIYEFRGADPELMDAVLEAFGEKQDQDVLYTSRRSRPSLVDFQNALFTRLFATRYPGRQSRVDPFRKEATEFGTALQVWTIGGKNQDDYALRIAGGVETLLASGVLVSDRARREVRPIEPADIAVLCLRNKQVLQVVRALEEAGIHASEVRPGIAFTHEGRLFLACLRRAISKYDSLAVAEIAALMGGQADPSHVIASRAAFMEEGQPSVSWLGDHEFIGRIDALSAATGVSSLSLLADEVIERLNLRRVVARWGNIEQRSANLDAMRGHVQTFEHETQSLGLAPTPLGFLTWMRKKAGDEADMQSENPGRTAVRVMTYHAAKGLEWPFVVCYQLDHQDVDRPWGVYVLSKDGVRADDPLQGRMIRFWPNPLIANKENRPGVDERLETSGHVKFVRGRDSDQDERLLYVGLTRARDYQALALNRPSKAGWGCKGLAKIGADWPLPEADEWEIGDDKLVIESSALSPPEGSIEPDEVLWTPKRSYEGSLQRLPLLIHPSGMTVPSGRSPTVGRILEYGERIPIKAGFSSDEIGDALHAFLCADLHRPTARDREGLLADILESRGLSGAFEANLAVRQAELFRALLLREFVPENIAAEVPIRHLRDEQIVTGVIDMLLKSSTGYIIVDHKSFQGKKSDRAEKAMSFAGQLQAYAAAVEAATRAEVVGTYVNFFVTGAMVEVK